MSARREFWLDLVERALKTGAQAAAGVLVGSNILAMDWRQAAAIVGTAVLASVLTSLGSAQIGDVGTASVIRRPDAGADLGRIVYQMRDAATDMLPQIFPGAPSLSSTSDWPAKVGQNVVRSAAESATAAWNQAKRGGGR